MLPSQGVFVYARYPAVAYAGGFGTGKTYALCKRILHLASLRPRSQLALLRLNATDLRQSTLRAWDDIVPESWVRRRNRTKGEEHDVLRNGSVVLFRHIRDAQRGKSHLASLSLAHVGIDEAHEIEEADYYKLLGRLRSDADTYHSIALAFNPAGHNWLYRAFYQGARILRNYPVASLKNWNWVYVKRNSLALAVPTLENTPENGGFLPAGYYENLLEQYPPEWAARYLFCSFDDFEGKVYPNYSLDSDHNITTYAADEANHDFYIGIDVGGQAPWAILRVAVERRWGYAVVYDELYAPNLGIEEVARWIHRDPRWAKAIIVIDYENRVAATELQRFGIATQVSRKGVLANILRVNSYLSPMRGIPHPETGKSPAPRLYFTAACPNTRREHDAALWRADDRGKNEPDPRQPDHARDALGYVLACLPEHRRPPSVSRPSLEALREADPLSYRFWRAIHAKERKDEGLADASDENIDFLVRGAEDEVYAEDTW